MLDKIVNLQAAHLKACASANGLTTRQLIDAVDLHKKQLAERKKLGLFPMAPPSAAPKKSAAKKVVLSYVEPPFLNIFGTNLNMSVFAPSLKEMLQE